VVTTSLSARVFLARQLQALDGIDWTVVSGDPYPDPPPGIAAQHVPMRRGLALSDLRAFVRLVRLFRRERYRFVQTHTQKASLLGLPAARLAGALPVYTMHGSLYFAGNPLRRNVPAWVFERWCCLWARRVLLQSREDAEALPRARICRASKLRWIGNGIRPDAFPRTPPPPASSRPTVLMIGRLVAEKGCRDYFAVARALASMARFVHVGPAEHDQRDAIAEGERAAAEAGGVEFAGEVADVRPFMAEADVVVLPSYREGIPRAAMEAASMGRPVVAYDVRGVREVIPPSSGLLVPVGDVRALTGRVRWLLESAGERAQMGEACAAHVAPFTEDAVVARLRAAYAELGLL
jgi:glycosyltransferase involved in cell wall biosynthesis